MRRGCRVIDVAIYFVFREQTNDASPGETNETVPSSQTFAHARGEGGHLQRHAKEPASAPPEDKKRGGSRGHYEWPGGRRVKPDAAKLTPPG